MGKFFRSHRIQFFGLLVLVIATLLFLVVSDEKESLGKEKLSFWQFRSIDTMKYSRDPSREKLKDPTFDRIIDQQVKEIADTGASHIAIATPYDEEFLPILRRWVNTARKYHLHVWFRGNWSGWEGWFGYPRIGREEHIKRSEEFILAHPYLFRDGDIFSACPECENGGPGDPRSNGDVEGHRKFLIDEYNATKAAFKEIGKKVETNYNSMNGDVARLVMDPKTTKALGGLVVIDHYVRTPEQLASDIKDIASNSEGKVVLGEFGAPIPDINGKMSEEEQAEWLAKTLRLLVQTNELVGVSYWTNVGGSTELWNGDGVARKAVDELKKIYNPVSISIVIKNELGEKVNSSLTAPSKTVNARTGEFSLIYLHESIPVRVTANGYETTTTTIEGKDITITLKKNHEDIFFKFRKMVKNLFPDK